MAKQFVKKQLEDLGKLYQKKNDEYGDTYHRFGPVMDAMFPDGLTLDNPEDFGRITLLEQIMGKLVRYASNFESGGHADSLDDIAVYSQMLQELDSEL